MKTTIEISDALWLETQNLAAREGVTMRQLIEQGLQQVLQQRNSPSEFKLRKASFKGEGLSAAAKDLSWDQIRDLS